jgi:protein gp37
MAADVPFHFKQWGDWVPGLRVGNETCNSAAARKVDDGTVMLRVGKKAAGRLLDGEMWDGMPQARAA